MSGGYEVGTTFMQVVPSFRGVVREISEEFTKYGEQAGEFFSESFDESVRVGTGQVDVGPSDDASARKGESAGGKFADAFRSRVDAALKALPDGKVNLDDEAAKLKLDDIRARMEALRDANIGVDINDTTALVALSAIKFDLDELARKSPSIRIKVDAAAAITEIEAVKVAADEASGESGGGGGIAGLGKSFSGVSPPVSILTSSILALGAALVPIGGVATGAAIGLTGMVTAAGAGIGAFGLAALPVFSQVSKAMQQITADQLAVTRATSATSKNTALVHLQSDLANLSPTVAAITLGVIGAKQAFLDWDAQFNPLIVNVFNAALADMMPFLRAITPLVTAGGNALITLFHSIGEGSGALGGLKTFVGFISDQVGPAVAALEQIIENLLNGFSGALQNSGPLITMVEQGLISLTAKFADFASSDTFRGFVRYVVAEGPQVGQFFERVVELVGRLLVAMAPVGKVILGIVTAIVTWVDHLLKAHPAIGTILVVIGGLIGAFSIVVAVLAPVIAAFTVLAAAAALLEIPVLAVVAIIAVVIIAIAAIAFGIYELVTHWRAVWSAIRDITNTVWHSIDNDVFHPIENFFTKSIPHAASVFSGAVTQAFQSVHNIVNTIWHAIDNDVLHPMERFFSVVIPPAVRVFMAIWNTAWKVVSTAVHVAWDIMHGIFVAIEIIALLPLAVAIRALQYAWAAAWPVIHAVVSAAWSILRPIFNFIKTVGLDTLHTGIAILEAVWKVAWSVISTVLSVAWSVMSAIFGFIKRIGLDVIHAGVQLLEGIWNTAWSSITSFLQVSWSVMSAVFGFIKTLGLDLIHDGVTILRDTWNVVFGGLSSAVDAAWSAIQPVIGFIKSAIQDLVGVLNDVISLIDSTLGWTGVHIDPIKVPFESTPVKYAKPSDPNFVGPIPGHAEGTGTGTFQGLTWVGEKGPELINLAAPAQIISNASLRSMGHIDLSDLSGRSGAREGHGINIEHAEFRDEANIEVLGRKADHMYRAAIL